MARINETQKLKALSAELVPTLWVGKNGVNAAIVLELQEQLKLRKMVKVRILKTALLESSRNEIACELSQASGAQLVDLKGATAVYRSPYRSKKPSKTMLCIRENDISKKDLKTFDSSKKSNLGD